MKITQIANGQSRTVTITAVEDQDYKRLTKKRYSFNWRSFIDAADIYKGRLYDKQVIYTNEFSERAGGMLHMPPGNNSEIVTISYTGDNKEWLRVEAVYKDNYKEYDEWKLFRTRLRFRNGGLEVRGEDWKPQRFLERGMPEKIYYDIRIPAQPFDRIEVSFLNETGGQDMVIDDVVITAYNGRKE